MKQSNSQTVSRTPEQRKEILSKVEQYKRDGLTVDAAREKAGITLSQYYDWRKRLGRKPKTQIRRKPANVVNFQIPNDQSDQIVILIGNQAHVNQALSQ